MTTTQLATSGLARVMPSTLGAWAVTGRTWRVVCVFLPGFVTPAWREPGASSHAV